MKTCFFIGHRDAPESIYDHLMMTIEKFIAAYCVTDFVVGRYGNFDHLAARAVMETKQRHPNVTLTLLVPYYKVNTAPLPNGFDGSLYPDGLENVPQRAAIPRANRYMIRHSDFLIVYDKGRVGNTRELVKYARHLEGKGLIIIENIAENR